MNYGVPNRASDGGPQGGRRECETCGSRKAETIGVCIYCAEDCCSTCAPETTEGLVCMRCVKRGMSEVLVYPEYEVELGAPLASQDTARWYAEAYRAGCGLGEAAAIESLATKEVN